MTTGRLDPEQSSGALVEVLPKLPGLAERIAWVMTVVPEALRARRALLLAQRRCGVLRRNPAVRNRLQNRTLRVVHR